MSEPTTLRKPNTGRAPRSYVLREGRLTDAQRRALQQLLPIYGVEPAAVPIDPQSFFTRRAPMHLEIGFGDGGALTQLAEQHPEYNFLGAEVHRPGIGRLLIEIHARQLTNIRIARQDGVQLLQALPAQSLAAIHLYFPDPWPKKKHHKRRLIQPTFTHLAADRLQPGGTLHFATDWQPYAEHALQVFADSAAFNIPANGFITRPNRPMTKFERRGVKLGHGVWDLVVVRAG